MTNKQTPEEFFNEIHKYANLPTGEDYTIAIALSDGDGIWANFVAAGGNYISPNGDLAADYHEFCSKNSLDKNDVANAERFLKQLKVEQKISKINEDFA